MSARTAALMLGWTIVLWSALGLLPGRHAAAIDDLRRYAGMVADARTGEVLYQAAPEELRYPASIAKVMTVYIVFEEMRAGAMDLTTQIRVSEHAAASVPTKLGLFAGSHIALGDALKALVTLSANDMARAIAEHIEGSEARFAERMTATARRLGMAHTIYRNASGLPDRNQLTTVRDQAVLAMAISTQFPEYYDLFQTRSFTYGRHTYGNHNRLLGYLGAVDGIKTGYINAAGSGIMVSARNGERHIVVIVLGMESASARDERARLLIATFIQP